MPLLPNRIRPRAPALRSLGEAGFTIFEVMMSTMILSLASFSW